MLMGIDTLTADFGSRDSDESGPAMGQAWETEIHVADCIVPPVRREKGISVERTRILNRFDWEL